MERKPFDPAGKHAVITGAGSGIGLALARALMELGGAVLMADVNEAAAVAEAEKLRAAGGRAIGMACDVTQGDQIEALAQLVVEPVDGLLRKQFAEQHHRRPQDAGAARTAGRQRPL